MLNKKVNIYILTNIKETKTFLFILKFLVKYEYIFMYSIQLLSKQLQIDFIESNLTQI